MVDLGLDAFSDLCLVLVQFDLGSALSLGISQIQFEQDLIQNLDLILVLFDPGLAQSLGLPQIQLEQDFRPPGPILV